MDNFDFTILRELRKKKGVSQAQLSEACNVTVQTISALEKGRYTPSLSTITSIARALDVDFADLVSYACIYDPKVVSCSAFSIGGIERKNCFLFDFNTMFVLNSEYFSGEQFCNQLFPLFDLYLMCVSDNSITLTIDDQDYNLNKHSVLYHDGMSKRMAEIKDQCKTIGIAVPRIGQYNRIFGKPKEQILSIAQDFTSSSQLLNRLDFSVLKLIRSVREITIENLAKISGVSEQAISDIEQNKRAPILSTISNIAKALGISISDFMDFVWRREPKVYDFLPLIDHREKVAGQVSANRVVLGDIVIDIVTNDSGEKVEVVGPADPFMEIAALPLKGQVETVIDGKSFVYGPGHALRYHCNKERTFRCSSDFEMVIIRKLKKDYFSSLRSDFIN